MQNTNKYLKITVALLLIANIALVAFMLWGKGDKVRKNNRPDITEMLAKELGFSEEQKTTHRQMSEENKKATRLLMDSIREEKVRYYESIKNLDLNDSLINRYESNVSALQIKLDKTMFAHFKRVRAFLQPAQQLKYDTLVVKMMNKGKRDSSARKN